MPNILPAIYFIRAARETRTEKERGKNKENDGEEKNHPEVAPLLSRCVLLVIKRPQICFGNRPNKSCVGAIPATSFGWRSFSNLLGFELCSWKILLPISHRNRIFFFNEKTYFIYIYYYCVCTHTYSMYDYS